MRELKVQLQVSADGYMADPNGDMRWLTGPWSNDLNAYGEALTNSVDCIVLGRQLAEGFIPAWAAMTPDDGEDQASIDWMNSTPKVVVSDSLTESPWPNTEIAGGDLTETISALRARPGADIITYGGSSLVQGLLTRGLVDEIHLFVNPTAIGAGLPVFPTLDGGLRLRLAAARGFDCGIAVLHYEPDRS